MIGGARDSGSRRKVIDVKQKSNSLTKGDRVGKTTKARGPVQRDAREVMAELVVKLSQKLEPQSTRKSEEDPRKAGMPGPNRDRLTVGVDLGDKWSNFCILGLDGEKLTEGELRTTPQDFAEFFQAMAGARVVDAKKVSSVLATRRQNQPCNAYPHWSGPEP